MTHRPHRRDLPESGRQRALPQRSLNRARQPKRWHTDGTPQERMRLSATCAFPRKRRQSPSRGRTACSGTKAGPRSRVLTCVDCLAPRQAAGVSSGEWRPSAHCRQDLGDRIPARRDPLHRRGSRTPPIRRRSHPRTGGSASHAERHPCVQKDKGGHRRRQQTHTMGSQARTGAPIPCEPEALVPGDRAPGVVNKQHGDDLLEHHPWLSDRLS